MASKREVIDLSGNARNLDVAKWIRTGQIYPENPPAELHAYMDALYEIPIEHGDTFLPIWATSKWLLPLRSH